ncbi:MAG: branched-chain amino acid aminotransferase [Pseudomonadota bacterium]
MTHAAPNGQACWTFFDGAWQEGNTPVAGPMTHAFWCGSSVFDGGRVFDGVAPDLLAHCERVNVSAVALNLNPTMEPEAIHELSLQGAKKFAPEQALYVRPMYFAEAGGFMSVPPNPDSTRFVLTLFSVPMPEAARGMRVGVSSFRRPTFETMPTNAKAGCLYPNNGRAVLEVQKRGFDNALVLDMLGNVAELATANVFLVKDGVVMTPAPNGTFLNGITRTRIIALLRDDGQEVVETSLSVADFEAADEIFSTGNYSKVMPVTHFEGRDLQPGPVAHAAREAYMAFAHDGQHAL